MTGKPDERAEEARRTLERAARESESLIGGATGRMAQRLGDHFAGRDAEPDDAIEVWGRRIGRVLSVFLAGALTWWLGAQLGWW